MCTPVHNYRCATPPKLSLEKGMGITPGYNHRLRLRNMLFADLVLSRRQLKALPSCAACFQRKHCSSQPNTSLLLFFLVCDIPWSLSIKNERTKKKKRSAPAFPCLCFSSRLGCWWCALFAAVLNVTARGRDVCALLCFLIQGCWWSSDKRGNI